MNQMGLAFVLVLSLAFSCSPTSRANRKPYEDDVLRHATLAVAPLAAQPQFLTSEENAGEFVLTMPAEIYRSYFEEGLALSLQSRAKFETIRPAMFKSAPSLQPRILPTQDDSFISLNLPTEPLEFDSLAADFTLFLEDVRAELTRENVEQGDPRRSISGSRNGTPQPPFSRAAAGPILFVQTAQFAFIDNHTHELVHYGTARSATVWQEEMPEFLLKSALDDLAKMLLSGTSFIK
ncbi:MAG: hypothetical protein ACE5IY_13590 [bacterium]